MRILHKITGAVLYSGDIANLEGANLEGADLEGADLEGANLEGAILRGAILDGGALRKTPLVVMGLNWWVMVTDGFLTIGCQRHTHTAWAAFTDAEIVKMDRKALRFWRQWRDPLLTMCAAHSADAEKVGD